MYDKYTDQVDLVLKEFGHRTPTLVYSEKILSEKCRTISGAIRSHSDASVVFPIKACYEPILLKSLIRNGVNGLEVMSSLELSHVRSIFGNNIPVIYSGLCPSESDVRSLNFETDLIVVNSLEDAQAIIESQRRSQKAKVLIRLSFPSLDSTIGYNSTSGKLGIIAYGPEMFQTFDLLSECSNVEIAGLHCHQLIHQTSPREFKRLIQELERFCSSVEPIYGVRFSVIDLGGGLESLNEALTTEILTTISREFSHRLSGRELFFEPGRALVNSCGLVVTSALGTRSREEVHYCFVDAGTNLLVPTASRRHVLASPISNESASDVKVTFADLVLSPANTIIEDSNLDCLPRKGDLFVFGNCGAYTASLEHQWCQRKHSVYFVDLWNRIHEVFSDEQSELAWQSRYGACL